MADESIVINVNPTREDYSRAMLKQSRKILFLSVPLVVLFSGVFVLFLILVIMSPAEGSKKYIALFLPFLVLLFVSLLPTLVLYNIRMQSRHLAEVAEPSEVAFFSDSIEVRSPSSSVQTLFTRYVKIVETDSDFIFFPQKQAFMPIAKRFFANEADIVEVRKRLVSSLGATAQVLN